MRNLLDNTLNQSSKSRLRNWTEIDDETRRTYNTSSLIKFKITVLELRLWNDSGAYILVKKM